MIDIFSPPLESKEKVQKIKTQPSNPLDIDFVPPSISANSYLWNHRAKIVILEDNDAVINSCVKQRSPTMRHVPRVHRVGLDTIWERISIHLSISVRHVNTKQQMADILTKGSFTKHTFDELSSLVQVGKSYPR